MQAQALGEKERVYQTVAAQLRVTDGYQHTCVSSFAIKGDFTLYLLAFISKEGCTFVQVICSLPVRGPNKCGIMTLLIETSLSQFFMFSWSYAFRFSVFISIFKFLLVSLI